MSDKPAPPEYTDSPVPWWQKISALALAVCLITLVVVFWDRMGADFWPPDAARVAPNIVAAVIQAIIVLAVAALLWPPTRKRIHVFMVSHTQPLHDHFDRLHEQRERHHAAQMKKLQEIHERVSRDSSSDIQQGSPRTTRSAAKKPKAESAGPD